MVALPNETDLQAMIDGLDDLVHVCEPDNRIVRVNRAFERWCPELGVSSAGVGCGIREVFPFLLPSIEAEYTRVFDSGSCLRTEEMYCFGEQERYTETRKIPLREDGRVTRVVTVVRDTTRQHRAALESAELADELGRAQRLAALGRLTGSVAHDFNNILTAIIGRSEILLRGPLDPGDPEQGLGEIRAAALKASALSRQLLRACREQDSSLEPVDLNEILSISLPLLTRLVGDGITLRFHPAPDLWDIKIDPVQMDQILINLAVNSRDAMPRGGVLQIETTNVTLPQNAAHSGEYVRLCVRDTGVGMRPEVARRAFEPGYTTKSRQGGTGLGLATVRRIVDQHRGFLRLETQVAEGTAFFIHFPRFQPE